MNLFSSAGIDLPKRGRVLRALRVPLLNHKVIKDALTKVHFASTEEQRNVAAAYAEIARSEKLIERNEVQVRGRFYDDILCKILGYTKIDPNHSYTLDIERQIRGGSVDVALGRFPGPDGRDEVIAPFEMKGPKITDLDAIVPGRGRSPVQQAWDYAIDSPGARWVLVSNCLDIRLYAFGRGRDAYEHFDLRKLDDEEQLERLWLILSANRFIGGATDALLQQSDNAYKDITGKLYSEYKILRDRLINFLTDSVDGPKLTPIVALELAQKILDRILFVAFAQRTDLLPDKLLERAAKETNAFRPEPLWNNFQALFKSINFGNDNLGIDEYNGGLFKPDPVADTLVIPDQLAINLAELGKWDYRSEVPVTLLGHIFEQSITDLEKLRAVTLGQAEPKISQRKREGVVYTPDMVTLFLAERTISLTLSEKFVSLLKKHADGKVKKNGDAIKWHDAEKSERAFWSEYTASLRELTIVDPACGSGAFLVAAFDLLAAEYRRAVERLIALGENIDFDFFDEIITKNLYGVDLNAESVEITRLALWLKTARRQHRLQNLEATIKVGNSLIDNKAFTERPFDWREAFPNIFAAGGFDIVIGNPPYVRMGLIKSIKPYLEEHYIVADDRTDLYAYFFERGVSVLKTGGRLGYISSSTFFRTGSGENLRKFLGDNVTIETVIDFGDLQLFEGVTTYPAIITLYKGNSTNNSALFFLKVGEELPKDLDAEFTAKATRMPRSRLGAGPWQFEDDRLARLRAKIVTGKKTLGEVYGAPLYGIKTGLNDAFVIDQETRDLMVKNDKKSQELLKPFLRGENVKRWCAEPEGLFLINTPKGKVKIDDYPAIRDWLVPFKAELESRATKQEWFELQQAQFAYQLQFLKQKIVFQRFQDRPLFCLDREGFFINNALWAIVGAGVTELAILNSTLAHAIFRAETTPLSGGFYQLNAHQLVRFPIPAIASAEGQALEKLGLLAVNAKLKRDNISRLVSHRILSDLSTKKQKKLSRKLHEWWTLDFGAFRAEVTRALHAEIAVKERSEWEIYLAGQATEVSKLDREIEKAECEIDTIVYHLFNLKPDEIRLLETSLVGLS
jgi:hypothetical protein